jgi:hypothetical protein
MNFVKIGIVQAIFFLGLKLISVCEFHIHFPLRLKFLITDSHVSLFLVKPCASFVKIGTGKAAVPLRA